MKRLGEMLVHAALMALFDVVLKGICGHGEDGDERSITAGEASDPPARLIAVHDRHHDIHENEVIVAKGRFAECLDSFRAIFTGGDLHAFFFKEIEYDLAVQLIVLDEEDVKTGEGDGSFARCFRFLRRMVDGEGNGDGEAGADALPAGEGDRASHF